MRVSVETVAKDLKKTRDGKEYTGIKLQDGRWVNIMGDHRDKKGMLMNVTEPKTLGNGKQLWCFEDTKAGKAEAQGGGGAGSQSNVKSGAKTFANWDEFVKQAHATAASIEPNDGQARAALVNTAVIAWADGKIIVTEEVEPEPTMDDVPF